MTNSTSNERGYLAQIRERREDAWNHARRQQAVEPPTWEDVGFLLSLYEQLRTENKRLNAIVSAYENQDEEALAEEYGL